MTNLCKTNPRQCWKKIKQQYTKNERNTENLNVSDLHGHFKNLYSNTIQYTIQNCISLKSHKVNT